MANYIGNQPSYGEFKRLDSISSSFNGSTTTFNLTYNSVSTPVGDASQLIVSLNGIIQEPLNSYTLGVGGSSIVFSSAPASGDTCFIMYIGGAGGTVTTISDGSVTASKLDASLKDYYEDEFTANGSTTDFTLSRDSIGVNQLLVTIDGIVQPTSAYTASGTTLTISPALPNGTNIRVVHMGAKAGVFVPQSGSVGLNELDLVGVDTRYYTQTAADATFETISNVALKAPIANPSFTGNVGIGTSSPNSPLEVSNGTENHRVAFGTGEVYLMARNASSYITQEYIANQHVFTGYGDNSSNEAMRIDSSGNLLVGKTDTSSNTAGTTIWKDGYLNSTVALPTPNTSYVARFNRKTTDGPILDLQKDGTTVGSIGSVDANSIRVGKGNGNLRFYDFGSAIGVIPCNSTGANYPNVVDLGNSSSTFKDLYLSGGIQFDSRSNKLDDYEEGYWFPYLEGSSGGSITSWTERMGWYVKVGGVCHAHFYLANPGTNAGLSGTTLIRGLPFVSRNNSSQGYGTNYYSNGVIAYNRGLSHVGSYLTWDIGNGHNYGALRAHYTNGTESATIGLNSVSSSLLLRGGISYQVD